jgi:hypothetical protein
MPEKTLDELLAETEELQPHTYPCGCAVNRPLDVLAEERMLYCRVHCVRISKELVPYPEGISNA